MVQVQSNLSSLLNDQAGDHAALLRLIDVLAQLGLNSSPLSWMKTAIETDWQNKDSLSFSNYLINVSIHRAMKHLLWDYKDQPYKA